MPETSYATSDGTVIVHIAPAYGEDDLRLGQQQGLPVLHAVGDDGHFLPEVTPVAGLLFKDADPIIIEWLREHGLLFRSETFLHSYPFRLADRRPAPLLREECLVHPHYCGARADDRAQSDDRLGPAGHSRRPVWQLAREQRRLGAVAGALLGDAAAAVDGRER